MPVQSFLRNANAQRCHHPASPDPSPQRVGTSYGRDADERVPLQSRAVSWIIVPPQWAELTLGCDFCTLQNAPRFLLLILLVSILIFASETLASAPPCPAACTGCGSP